MTEKINLKEIEKKAWISCSSLDGLFDIAIGLIMLTTGIRTLADNAWFTLLILAAVLVVVVGKRYITTPRIGRVKFGAVRKVKQRNVIAVLGISVLANLVLLLLSNSELILPEMSISPIVAIWLLVVFGLLAYYLDFRRLYVYGLLFAISEVLWGLFDKPTGPIAFSVSGSAALLIGTVLLIRFLRRYPIPAGV